MADGSTAPFVMHGARDATVNGFGHIEEQVKGIERAVAENPGLAALHQAREVGGLSRIATQEPVFSQPPQIPGSGCRIAGQRWQDVFRLRPRGGHISQEQVDLRRLKPGQGDIEASNAGLLIRHLAERHIVSTARKRGLPSATR
jgi:hypothetical protein